MLDSDLVAAAEEGGQVTCEPAGTRDRNTESPFRSIPEFAPQQKRSGGVN